MPTYPLTRAAEPLIADVKIGPITRAALAPFDLDPDLDSKFYPWELPSSLPDSGDYGIGLIVGASGSGKSKLLRSIADPEQPEWEHGVALAEHFASAEEAAERFYAVGLNTVPIWRLPYDVLSNGQQFRADLARSLHIGAVIDEFTSVVDRNVAVSASRAMRGYVDRMGLTDIVLASCHRDVIPWLRPDWIIDTDAGTLTVGQTDEAPKWFAEHITGPAVGRLTLAVGTADVSPATPTPEAVVEPAAVVQDEPADPILAAIAAATKEGDLRSIYFANEASWTKEHTDAAVARKKEIS